MQSIKFRASSLPTGLLPIVPITRRLSNNRRLDPSPVPRTLRAHLLSQPPRPLTVPAWPTHNQTKAKTLVHHFSPNELRITTNQQRPIPIKAQKGRKWQDDIPREVWLTISIVVVTQEATIHILAQGIRSRAKRVDEIQVTQLITKKPNCRLE